MKWVAIHLPHILPPLLAFFFLARLAVWAASQPPLALHRRGDNRVESSSRCGLCASSPAGSAHHSNLWSECARSTGSWLFDRALDLHPQPAGRAIGRLADLAACRDELDRTGRGDDQVGRTRLAPNCAARPGAASARRDRLVDDARTRSTDYCHRRPDAVSPIGWCFYVRRLSPRDHRHLVGDHRAMAPLPLSDSRTNRSALQHADTSHLRWCRQGVLPLRLGDG